MEGVRAAKEGATSDGSGLGDSQILDLVDSAHGPIR